MVGLVRNWNKLSREIVECSKWQCSRSGFEESDLDKDVSAHWKGVETR